MALSETPRQQALHELDDTICAVCGSFKKSQRSFCGACYFKLSQPMQAGLTSRFGHGYEENYQEAKDWLRQERKASEGSQ